MKNHSLISSRIEEFYSAISDEKRYETGLGPLELERNKIIIKRYLTSHSSVIIDVGGGTGIYSEWLAKLGHTVYLIDPVKKHISKAKQRAINTKQNYSCLLGEAKDLDFEDNSADMVILHGPLYHLQSKKDRIKALKEAKRVCRKNGIIIGVAINFSSFTLVGLLNGMIYTKGFYEMCKTHLETGIHQPPAKNEQQFLTEAFFHQPTELLEEFGEVQLKEIELIAVEGFIWLDKDYFQSMGDPVKKKVLMSLLNLTEKFISLISLSPHMIAVAKNY